MKNKKQKTEKAMTEITNNSKIKIILMVFILLLAVVPLWYKSKDIELKEKKKEITEYSHKEDSIVKDETFKNLKFTDISLITKNGITTFSATVTNVGNTENGYENVYIDLNDKKGKVLTSLKGSIGKLAPNGITRINTSAKGTFKDATSKTIREYKN